ncbi:MAG TPA: hypothetical protein VHD83_19625 [Puia sp.]|nr:hypothetical protein [Puia sp.]
MKFHKTLSYLTLFNFVGSLIVLYCCYRFIPGMEDFGNAILSWIAWLGVFAAEAQFFSADTRSEWFSKEYGPGTVVLLLLNVAAAIAANAMAYSIAK